MKVSLAVADARCRCPRLTAGDAAVLANLARYSRAERTLSWPTSPWGRVA